MPLAGPGRRWKLRDKQARVRVQYVLEDTWNRVFQWRTDLPPLIAAGYGLARKGLQAMRNDERTERDAPGGDRVEADSPYLPLARWLQQVMAPDTLTATDHEKLFQQLPDFIAYLLAHDPQQLPEQFGPLVYHLIGCQTCRGSYLELYRAMQEALLEEDTEALAE
jgi:hypothetical protein